MKPLQALNSHRRYIFFFLAFVVMAISFAPAATTPVQAGASNACVLTEEQIGGQANMFVYGQSNLFVYGQSNLFVYGMANMFVYGQANSTMVFGMGYNSIAELLAEIAANTIDKNWIRGFVPEIGPANSAFNKVPVAILVVDDFDDDKVMEHGEQVGGVVQDLIDSLNSDPAISQNVMIAAYPVDISVNGSYDLEVIANALANKINQLETVGDQGVIFKHFVINTSIGAVVPCVDSTIDIGGGETWDYYKFLNESQGPQKIVPTLQCVENNNGLYTAHFGYDSFNPTAVHIPVGTNNTFNTMSYLYQPQYFQPGQHEDVFRADFWDTTPDDGVPPSITWTVKNGTHTYSATASPSSTPCPAEAPNTAVSVTPTLTCVATNPDPAGNGKAPYRAYFGYQSNADTRIPIGENNRFASPAYLDFGQPREFKAGDIPFAFEVDFDGMPLTWVVETDNGVRSATAMMDENTIMCPSYPMFDDSLTLVQYLFTTGASSTILNEILTGLDDNDAALAPLANLLQSYEERSASDKYFRAITMASSGNYALTYPDPTAAPPLWPAKLDTTIAVAGSLGDEPTSGRFVSSQLGNVMAPGAWYNIVDANTGYSAYVSGTSYSAPQASVVAAMWLTHPNACNFGTTAAPQRPLKSWATDLTNDLFFASTDGSGMPLDCAPNYPPQTNPDWAQTPMDVNVTIDVLANDINANSVSISNNPTNGAAVVNANQTITYNPNANFPATPGTTAVDYIGYVASDGYLNSGVETVGIEVARLDLLGTCNGNSWTVTVANPMTQLGSTPAMSVNYAVNGVSAGTIQVAAASSAVLPINYAVGSTVSVSVNGVVHDTYVAQTNPCLPKVGYFFVVDSDADAIVPVYDPYDPLANNQTLDLSVVPSHKINIVAVVTPGDVNGNIPVKVEFYVDGVLFYVDTTAHDDGKHPPYQFSLAGDTIRADGSIDYEFWRLQPNKFVEVKAVPYDGNGNAGTPLTIRFRPTESKN